MEGEVVIEGSEGVVDDSQVTEGSEAVPTATEVLEGEVIEQPTEYQEVLQKLDDINTNNITFYNNVTDISIILIAVVVGGLAVKTFFQGATKW